MTIAERLRARVYNFFNKAGVLNFYSINGDLSIAYCLLENRNLQFVLSQFNPTGSVEQPNKPFAYTYGILMHFASFVPIVINRRRFTCRSGKQAANDKLKITVVLKIKICMLKKRKEK